jgi:hypothetical protein
MDTNGKRPLMAAKVEESHVRQDDEPRKSGESDHPPRMAARIPIRGDEERQQREWEAEAGEYYAEEHELYLKTLIHKKPDLLTRAKIHEIVGKFQTIKELSAGGYEPNSWLVQRLIPSDSIVTLQGEAKSGKSTFIFHMVKELITGGQFLGQKLEPTNVVYVTEQNRKSFLSQLESADIDPDSTKLTALTVERTLGFGGWENLFQACEKQVLETGAKLLVIDSWGRFTGITEQEENKSAPVQERITVLRKLVTNTGATVLILHHVRKSGGGIVDAGMGSSALAQQVDVLLSLSGQPAEEGVSPKKVSGPECRMIQSKGRFPDMMNEEQVKWEKESHRFVLVGRAAHALTFVEKLLSLLPTAADKAVDAAALALLHLGTYGSTTPGSVENNLPKLKEYPSVRQVKGTGVKGTPARLYKDAK